MDTANKITQLQAFIIRDKFSKEAWNAMGMNPSDEATTNQVNTLFNACAEALLKAIQEGHNSKEVKKLLLKHLSNFKASEFDTVEREFICDLFQELAKILDTNIDNQLEKWLYGIIISTLSNTFRFFKSDKVIETLQHPCTKCGVILESYVKRKKKGIPETDWFIAKCLECHEPNLLSSGPDVQELEFGNYQHLKTVSKSKYSYEEALDMLNEFR